MLKSKSVAKIIQDALNSNDKDEHFKIFDSAGDYKATDINGVLKQNKATIVPTLNYINANVPYSLELIVPMQCGEDRLDDIVNIVNKAIKTLNGKVKEIDRGKAIFLFDTIDMGGLETRATAGQSLKLGLSFSVEYSNKDVGTRYEIALIDNAFSGTINTRYFESQEDQAKWYEEQIDKGVYNDLLSPNINSLVLSQQRYTNDTGVDVNELLMYNYAIIRETKEDGTKNYYYYDVINASVNTNNLIILDLKMDTLQTWYFNPEIKFDDCFIERADINRFIEVDSDTVKFDTRPESELFEREDIQNVTKRLVKREVVDVSTVIGAFGNGTSQWIKDNILGWYYIFLSSNVRYPVGDFSKPNGQDGVKLKSMNYRNKTIYDIYDEDIKKAGLYNTLCCVCFPAFKTDKKIVYREMSPNSTLDNLSFTDNALILDKDGLNGFLSSFSAENIYSIKFSLVPPLIYMHGHVTDGTEYASAQKGDLIVYGKTFVSSFEVENNQYEYKTLVDPAMDFHSDVEVVSCYTPNDITGGYGNYGMFNVLSQIHIDTDIIYNTWIPYKFEKSYIINSKHDMTFNPKLLSSDYAGIVLSDNLQNGAEYDILKLGSNVLHINYTEALTPDITKRYIRFAELDGYYIPETSDNLTGYVVSDDTSLTLESSAYQSMLANNKNFFLQNSINRGAEYGMSVMGSIFQGAGAGVSALLTGNIGGLASSGLGIAQNMASAKMNKELSKVNENLIVDNLKNAPNSINGAKGNVIFNSMYSEMGIVVETHEIIPNEKKMVDDRINLYGMTFNKVANIKDYDNMRRYHNYIEADIDGIYGIPISNAIKDDIRDRFAGGIRFWNKNKENKFVISYEEENYERWLED